MHTVAKHVYMQLTPKNTWWSIIMQHKLAALPSFEGIGIHDFFSAVYPNTGNLPFKHMLKSYTPLVRSHNASIYIVSFTHIDMYFMY